MTINIKACDFIAHFEGFSPTVYQCPGGFQTIGYGHRIKRGEDIPAHLSQLEGLALLHQDILFIKRSVDRLIHIDLSPGQEVALLSFTFNLGPAALQRSTLRLKVNREEHEAVPHELMKWIWSRGKRLPGLVRRRTAEGALYRY